uniref:Uncharacterized protein n=1 Tax=uncultured bacterium contig00036 TaxID=1181524 RepID=A0A806KEK2_9BACT|nr:hypothetical protein [uncultured bacterium contig00036]
MPIFFSNQNTASALQQEKAKKERELAVHVENIRSLWSSIEEEFIQTSSNIDATIRAEAIVNDIINGRDTHMIAFFPQARELGAEKEALSKLTKKLHEVIALQEEIKDLERKSSA